MSWIKVGDDSYLITDDVSAEQRAAHAALTAALESADGLNQYDAMAWLVMRELGDRGHWIVKGGAT
jgi:N-acetylglucosamine kinase-like BadF-type ATPase